MIGFGDYHYVGESGREGDWFLTGFSPRKTSLVLYLPGLRNYAAKIKKLGKSKASGGCLHIKHLADVDVKLLKDLVTEAVKAKRAKAK